DPVAAGRGRAVGLARVVLGVVAIVAVLDPGPDVKVSTGRDHAGREASVVVVGVAVVAGLALLEDPVAAAREGAEVGALVVIDVVAVVAPLARADQVVPADLRRAVELAGALVGVGVTVIAGLARLDLAVAALGI